MPRIFPVRIPVAAGDIDGNEHVNNLAYLRWMQEAAWAHSTAQGWTRERYRELGSGWFVRSHFIEYLRPAHPGDVLLRIHAPDRPTPIAIGGGNDGGSSFRAMFEGMEDI